MPDSYVNGIVAGSGTPSTLVTLLLVEPDAGLAEQMERHLAHTLPGLVATRCETLASARAYLAGSAFDAVCTADELPDGSGLSLLDLREGLHLKAPFFVRTRRNGAATARAEEAGAAACFVLTEEEDGAAAASEIGRHLERSGFGQAPDDAPAPDHELVDPHALIEALRSETGIVAHAINNPLTVIAGNAQFLLEMARAGGLDPGFAQPIEDIEAATHQLAEALDRLAELRQRIAAALGSADRL